MTRPRMDVPGGQGDALEHVDPVSLAVAISKLPPNHALVAAARTGAEVADARWERREAERQASKDVAAAAQKTLGRGWADRRVPRDEIERRRAEVPAQRREPVDADLEAAFRSARAACAAATHEQQPDEDDDQEGDQGGEHTRSADRDEELVDER
jgi:hypothetical protein